MGVAAMIDLTTEAGRHTFFKAVANSQSRHSLAIGFVESERTALDAREQDDPHNLTALGAIAVRLARAERYRRATEAVDDARLNVRQSSSVTCFDRVVAERVVRLVLAVEESERAWNALVETGCYDPEKDR